MISFAGSVRPECEGVAVCRRTFLLAAALAVALTVSPRGADKHPVTIDDALNFRTVSGAVISPDGARVLFTVRAWEWPGGKAEPDKGTRPPDMRSHVWMVTTGGTEPARQITFGERGEASPAWSPDGRQISFTATRSAGSATSGGEAGPKAQIWLMRADGGEAWQLTDAKEGVGAYQWAPDSRQIAYLMRDPLSREEEEARRRKDDAQVFEADYRLQHIWVIDVEST